MNKSTPTLTWTNYFDVGYDVVEGPWYYDNAKPLLFEAGCFLIRTSGDDDGCGDDGVMMINGGQATKKNHR